MNCADTDSNKKKVDEPRRTIYPYAVFSGSALCFQASQQEEKWRRWLTEYNALH